MQRSLSYVCKVGAVGLLFVCAKLQATCTIQGWSYFVLRGGGGCTDDRNMWQHLLLKWLTTVHVSWIGRVELGNVVVSINQNIFNYLLL